MQPTHNNKTRRRATATGFRPVKGLDTEAT